MQGRAGGKLDGACKGRMPRWRASDGGRCIGWVGEGRYVRLVSLCDRELRDRSLILPNGGCVLQVSG